MFLLPNHRHILSSPIFFSLTPHVARMNVWSATSDSLTKSRDKLYQNIDIAELPCLEKISDHWSLLNHDHHPPVGLSQSNSVSWRGKRMLCISLSSLRVSDCPHCIPTLSDMLWLCLEKVSCPHPIVKVLDRLGYIVSHGCIVPGIFCPNYFQPWEILSQLVYPLLRHFVPLSSLDQNP